MVWYSQLFQNLPQFIVIHIVKGFGIVNKAEIDVFLEFSCFFDDPADVGNWTSGSSAFSKTSLNIWTRVNIDILGIRELWWTGMGEFNSDDHYINYCGQESPGRNGVVIIVNKTVWNAVLGYNIKNDRMISVRFQGKPFNITVIQVYAPTSNVEETEVEQFDEDLQDLLELTPKKRCPFQYRGLECKSRKSRNTWSSKFGLE